jgi:hypothetical protein
MLQGKLRDGRNVKGMKKKWIMMGGAVGISSVIMLTTGFTALASNSGYEDYKAALKVTQALSSVTIQGNAVLKDNNSILNEATGSLKANLVDEATSGTVKVTGSNAEQSVSLYTIPNGQAWKSADSNTYYVKQDKLEQGNKETADNEDKSSWMSQQAETVIDALVGQLKNEVVVNQQSDGSKKISIQLDSAQIPAVVQALAPLAFKKISGDEERNQQDTATESQDPENLFNKNLLNFKDVALTQDIQIQNFSLHADINSSNQIEHQQASITFVGKDANGVAHTLDANLDVYLSAFNQTIPDSIDLTGKQVQQIKDDHQERDHG